MTTVSSDASVDVLKDTVGDSDGAQESRREKIPVRNWWHMLLYAWDLVEFKERFKTEAEDAPDLRALLTSILVFLMKHQIRRGLRGDYVERSEELQGVRGRIDFGETLRGLSMYRGRLHCEFEEFTLNVPRNQIIRSTLNDSLNREFTQVEKERPRYGRLVADLEALLRMLYEIDRIRVTRRLIASELRLLGRNEREYMLMLKICEMLRDPLMPQTDAVPDIDVVDWLQEKEPRIFELFVANYYKLRLDGNGWDVSAPKTLKWNEGMDTPDDELRLPIMKPDIVLRRLGGIQQFVVLDTKWYRHVASEYYGNLNVHSANLYQVYAYLASQDHESEAHRTATGILLYGRTKEGERKLRTRIDDHPFWVETLDLYQDWEDIERDLARLVEETVGDE